MGTPHRESYVGKGLEVGRCVCGLLPEFLLPYHMDSLTSRNITDHLSDLLSSQSLSTLRLFRCPPPPLRAGARKGHTVILDLYPVLPQPAISSNPGNKCLSPGKAHTHSLAMSLGARSHEPALVVGLEGMLWEEGSREREGTFPIG